MKVDGGKAVLASSAFMQLSQHIEVDLHLE